MSNAKRMAALLLAALLALTACGSGSGSKEDSAQPDGGSDAVESGQAEETEPADPGAFVPEGVGYDGQTIRFLTSSAYNDGNTSEIAPDADGYQPGEIIPEAVVERNNLVYEKIGVELEAIPTGGSEWSSYQKILENSVASGVNDYDAICGSVYGAYKSAVKQLLVNLAGVDTLDLSHPWWSQRSRKALDFGDTSSIIYYMNGDINYFDNWGTSCIFFNKDFLKDYGYDAPYDLVRQYKWTWDTMKTMADGMYRDIDADGKKSFEDAYGYVANWHVMERLMPSMDLPILYKNEEGDLLINETEYFVNAAETLYAYFSNDMNVWLDGGSYAGIFTRGDAAFSEDNLSYIRRASGDLESDYGILPYPMWEEGKQEYFCTTSEAYATVVGITLTADKAMIGTVLDVMGAYSPQTITKAVIDNGAMIRNARDEDTAEMISVIMNSTIYPYNLVVSWAEVDTIFHGRLMNNMNLDYISTAAKMRKPIQKGAEKDFEKLRDPKG